MTGEIRAKRDAKRTSRVYGFAGSGIGAAFALTPGFLDVAARWKTNAKRQTHSFEWGLKERKHV